MGGGAQFPRLQCHCHRRFEVTYHSQSGEEVALPADSIVISVGMGARSEEAMDFYGTAPSVYMIGNCKRPGTIVECNRTAFAVSHKIQMDSKIYC